MIERRKLMYQNNLSLESLESRTLLTPVFWDGGGNGTSWHDRFNWSTNALPGPSSDVVIDVAANPTITLSQDLATIRSLVCREALTISGGQLTIEDPSAVHGTFTLSDGGVFGSGDLTVHGAMSWTGGTLSGAGRVVMPAAASLVIGGADGKFLSRSLESAGTASWTGGAVYCSGGTFTNMAGAVFTASAAASFVYTGEGGGFQNAGTVTKTGSGATEFAVPFDSAGTVNVAAGTLALSRGGNHAGLITVAGPARLDLGGFLGGDTAYAAVSSITGGGTVWFIGGAHSFSGQLATTGAVNIQTWVAFDAAQTLGGPLNLLTYGDLAGSATVAVTGALAWTGGTMSGTGRTLASGPASVLTISGSESKFLSRALDNGRIGSWSGNPIYMNNGVFTNLAGAVFTAPAGGDVWSNGGVNRFVNHGAFTKPGDDTLTIRTPFDNSGTTDVQGGRLALTGGGNHSGSVGVAASARVEFGGFTDHSGSAAATGAGTVAFVDGGTHVVLGVLTPGTIDIAATVEFNTARTVPSIVNLMDTGVIGGGGEVVLVNTLNWIGGMMSGSGRTIVDPGAALNFVGDGTKLLARLLDNHGTAAWSLGRIVFIGGTFNNLAGAEFNASADESLFGAGGVNAVNNHGRFTKTGGSTTVVRVAFNNSASGLVAVEEGVLRLGGGGSHTNDVGVGAKGTLELGGATVYAAPSAVVGAGRVTFIDGNHDFAGRLESTGDITIVGVLNFGAAQLLTGVVHLLDNGELGGAADATFTGRLRWVGGAMTGAGRTIITQNAALDMIGERSMILARRVDNHGTGVWLAGRVFCNGATFNNLVGATFTTGVEDDFAWAAGFNLFNNAGTFTKTGATTTRLRVGIVNTGTMVAEDGVLWLGGNHSVLNSGLLAAGPGVELYVEINYTQTAEGTLEIRVDGPSQADSGHLTVRGGPTVLAGCLRVAPVNGFEPDCMNVEVVDGADMAGAFTRLELPVVVDHQSLAVYDGDEIRFAVSPFADYDRNGIVDSNDYFAFLTAFFNGTADFNGDGEVNSNDYFAFLDVFFRRCD